jgi:hypothetical protein
VLAGTADDLNLPFGPVRSGAGNDAQEITCVTALRCT